MNLASDPPIERKMMRMAHRVRWQHPAIRARTIDQTRLVLEQPGLSNAEHAAFHFLVLGDSGTGRHRRHSPPRHIAERLLPHKSRAAFLLHTGDVVYLVGAAAQYRNNFIRPYREWLTGGEQWESLSPQKLLFNQPFLPVLGNHDYYDLAPIMSALAGLTLPLRRHLQWFHDVDTGWRGSDQGGCFAHAFMDVLSDVPSSQLGDYLDRHYAAEWDGHRCLQYRPNIHSRIPNRYYRFRHAGVDVFALDSNTLIAPVSSRDDRAQLRQQLKSLDEEQTRCLKALSLKARDEQQRDGLMDDLETLQEERLDLQRRLQHHSAVDAEQLRWLRDGLIASHLDPTARGRILTLHHPPYVTERTKWSQADTLAIRQRLRTVLDDVNSALGHQSRSRRTVDLVLSGHAHCLEVLRTHDTGHGDSFSNWVVCGGSGYSLRDQRGQGPHLSEASGQGDERVIASSDLYVGRSWADCNGGKAYSALRIDISEGSPLRIRLIPLISNREDDGWNEVTMNPIELPQPDQCRPTVASAD